MAGVAQALTDALGDRVDMTLLRMSQPGARWPAWMKPLALPARYLEAERIASTVRDHLPPFNVAHYHWGPNGLAALARGGNGPQPPWVLHLHGTDARSPNHLTKRAIRAASHVLYSTPDLAPLIGRPATHLPVPIPTLDIREVEPKWDVLLSAWGAIEKGSEIAFAAARLIDARIAALGGPGWEDGPWERLPMQSKPAWHDTIRASRVVVGQFRAGTLGISDLEAMMLGRPLVTWIDPKWHPDLPPVTIAREPADIAAAVRRLLTDPPDPEPARQWVIRHHAPEMVAQRLLGVYSAPLIPNE